MTKLTPLVRALGALVPILMIAAASAAPAGAARPYAEGQPGRAVVGGTWWFRLDDENVGIDERYTDQRSLGGWRRVRIPHNWNGAGTVLNRSSVGWYRRDIKLARDPGQTLRVARFEGANHYATVYANGRKVGEHAGGYLPFEVDLTGLRKGVNRLVVRVSTMRAKTDLTHWRPAGFNGYGTGGWWNLGGLSREVTIRRIGALDIERAQALPRLRCPTCAARVEVRSLVRNRSARSRWVTLRYKVGRRVVRLAPRWIGAGRRREIVAAFTIARPRLWQVGRGGLYGLRVTAAARGVPGVAYTTSFGVRDVRRLGDGTVLLNGRPLQLRGVNVHEENPGIGAAWGPADRAAALARLGELGATIVRTHYPLHPAMLEAFDRAGIMVWDGAPVYQVQNDRLNDARVRRNAVAVNREMVLRDRGHPSVLAYSIANELPDPIGPGHAAFIRSAAIAIRKLDTTRLVALDRVARLGAADDANPVLGVLDAIGVNEYYGWYRGSFPPLDPAITADLGPYLDGLHASQPRAALFVTEFGAESAREGPDTEKGTYAFQARFLREHLAAIASKPYVGGATIWVLRDFRVHPAWTGGNPIPDPPYNHKGLLAVDGTPKPAFFEAQRIFRATSPLR